MRTLLIQKGKNVSVLIELSEQDKILKEAIELFEKYMRWNMIRLSDCDNCKHRKGMKGCLPACDAFPEGIPYEFDDSKVIELKECKNGIGYEAPEK